ncbi:MAG: hypothetical protein P8Y45_10880, partial [Exilibacterium sp.]
MRLNELLENLARLNITLSVEGGALHINAAKGSLSLELKEQLINHKDELIKWLQAREVNENRPSLPDIKHDGVNRYTAFPLSDLQVGFYMADDPYMEYQVRPHYYMEFNRIDFDIARYEQAWNKALRRHSGELP